MVYRRPEPISEILYEQQKIFNDYFFRATADGNCLYNSCSILVVGTEKLAKDLRIAVSIELFLNCEFYHCHPYVTAKMNEDPTLKLDRLNNEIVKKECHDYQKGDIIHKEAIHNLRNHSWSSPMNFE